MQRQKRRRTVNWLVETRWSQGVYVYRALERHVYTRSLKLNPSEYLRHSYLGPATCNRSVYRTCIRPASHATQDSPDPRKTNPVQK